MNEMIEKLKKHMANLDFILSLFCFFPLFQDAPRWVTCCGSSISHSLYTHILKITSLTDSQFQYVKFFEDVTQPFQKYTYSNKVLLNSNPQ